MPYEFGSVTASREAYLLVRFADGEAVECLIDTGFNGQLMLPRTDVDRLLYRGP